MRILIDKVDEKIVSINQPEVVIHSGRFRIIGMLVLDQWTGDDHPFLNAPG
jgi:hypothetical protein